MALKNNKSLGQHWLKDRVVLDAIAELAVTENIDHCLEIGPGLGTLTSSLLKRFSKVTAIEYDERLAKNLPGSFPGKNLEVINADFLQFDLSTVKAPYVVAGNIPYYITSPIILKLISEQNTSEAIVLLIQKEVAERIAAEKGGHTVISLTVQNRAYVSLGPVVGKELFTPPPKVDSQVIILTPHKPVVSDEVIKLIKRGFSNPRKKLIKNLGQVSKEDLVKIFDKLGFDQNIRPSDLDLDEWQSLYDAVKHNPIEKNSR